MIGEFRKDNRFDGGVLIGDYHGMEKGTECRLLTCCHCQFTWEFEKNGKSPEGIARGWCSRCMGHVCGLPACRAKGCVHFEAMLEMMEHGIPWGMVHEDRRPIIVMSGFES